MTPREITRIAYIPVTIDLAVIGTERHVFISDIDAIDRHARHVPGIDVAPQVARPPAEGARTIVLERRGNVASHRAARAGTLSSGRARSKGRSWRGEGRGGCGPYIQRT